MKWYFCLNESGLKNLGEAALVAAASCIKNTKLEPNLIYGGTQNSFTEYLEGLGVLVHHHELSFAADIERAADTPGFSKYAALGAYLRYDIPIINKSDEVVLYTDADVIFVKDPMVVIENLDLFAACPEYENSGNHPVAVSSVLNSGVMLMHLGRFRRELEGLIQFCKDHGFYFHGVGGFYDQGALNKYFVGRWQELSQTLNWRPYASHHEPPSIIHFHGTKPHEILTLINHGTSGRDVSDKLFSLSPGNYTEALCLYKTFLKSKGRDALIESCFDALLCN